MILCISLKFLLYSCKTLTKKCDSKRVTKNKKRKIVIRLCKPTQFLFSRNTCCPLKVRQSVCNGDALKDQGAEKYFLKREEMKFQGHEYSGSFMLFRDSFIWLIISNVFNWLTALRHFWQLRFYLFYLFDII